jgi:hypothetical protein
MCSRVVGNSDQIASYARLQPGNISVASTGMMRNRVVHLLSEWVQNRLDINQSIGPTKNALPTNITQGRLPEHHLSGGVAKQPCPASETE